MKKKDKKELHAISEAERAKKIKELRKQIQDERIKRVSTSVKNTRLVKHIRHQLAAALTIKREKELIGK